MTREELQKRLDLMDRENFRNNYIIPALRAGVIAMTIPDKPRSKNQKYRLTAIGKQMREKNRQEG